MPPILARPTRLLLYLAAWIPVAGLLAGLLSGLTDISFSRSLIFAFPQALIYAFLCLAAWYPCKVMPFRQTHPVTLLISHLLAAGVFSSLWVLIGSIWTGILFEGEKLTGVVEDPYLANSVLFYTIGMTFYIIAVAVHYLVHAVEEAQKAEKRALAMRVLARETELKALRAQVNPHFLFNSMNSIHALMGTSTEAARKMCLQLADFLRSSLKTETTDQVPLQRELSLARNYLEVEQVRFGKRLEIDIQATEEMQAHLVPPLLLQPLVENAVVHGIAHLLDGGVVDIRVKTHEDRLQICVKNPVAEDRPPSNGEGVGLNNVEARLINQYGEKAGLKVVADKKNFSACIHIPLDRSTE